MRDSHFPSAYFDVEMTKTWLETTRIASKVSKSDETSEILKVTHKKQKNAKITQIFEILNKT